jgi:cytochrome c peroxidase
MPSSYIAARRAAVPLALSAVALAVIWQGGASLLAPPSSIAFAPVSLQPEPIDEPISPIPSVLPLNERKIVLGGRLFHDRRLSRDGSVACASCHDLGKGGVDGLTQSVGIGGRRGDFNAPTVFNSGFNFRQFWNGRAATLEDQIDGPVQNPKEMGSSWSEVVGKLSRDAAYEAEFKAVYGTPIEPSSVKDAIAEFERSLVTPNSRFDKFLRGERGALTVDELKGYQLFKRYGCIACHQGVNVGGNLYERLGVMSPYFDDTAEIAAASLGRMALTGKPEDIHIFKVPSLRNVALTAPYFHDGSVPTLERAVTIMGQFQLGVSIPPADVALIVQFLGTLTGEHAGASR